MQRRPVMMVLTAVAATVLLASVATSGEVHFWHAATSSTQSDDVVSAPLTAPPAAGHPLPKADPANDAGLPHWLAWLFQFSVILCVVALVVSGVLILWRLRPKAHRAQLDESNGAGALIDMSRIITDDAAAQRVALLHGAPRNAIVACWLRLESTVAAAGLARDEAETSTELTARLLAYYTVDEPAVDRLAALYREARFSTHTMGEGQRDDALDALDAIHESLRVAAARPVHA